MIEIEEGFQLIRGSEMAHMDHTGMEKHLMRDGSLAR